MLGQKGSVLLVSILASLLIIGLVGIYELQGGWSNKPTNSGYQADVDLAKETQIKVDFKQIQTALELYRLNKGSYPQTLDDLVKASALNMIPKNPYTKLDYNFNSTNNAYTLSTKLGDGNEYQITN